MLARLINAANEALAVLPESDIATDLADVLDNFPALRSFTDSEHHRFAGANDLPGGNPPLIGTYLAITKPGRPAVPFTVIAARFDSETPATVTVYDADDELVALFPFQHPTDAVEFARFILSGSISVASLTRINNAV